MKKIDIKYIALLCLFLLVATVSFTKISDYDLWWHLKLGETVFESGHVYGADSFSYTFNGQPQFNGEWLADLIIYLFYRAGGFPGLNILKMILLIFTFAFLYKALKYKSDDEKAGFYASVITLLLVFFSVRFRLFIRPYLFSYMFFALTLFLLCRYDRKADLKGLWFFPVIVLAWANMSKAAVFGPLLFLLFLIADALKNKALNPRLLMLLAVMVIASLCSPVTFRLYGLAGQYVTDRSVLGEMQPLSLKLLWDYGFAYTAVYQVLVLLSVVCLVFFRGWKNLFYLAMVIIFFGESVKMVRMIDFFSLAAVPLVHTTIEKTLGSARLSGSFSRKGPMTIVLSVCLLALIPLSIVGSRSYSFGAGVKDDIFPDRAMAFLDRERVGGRLFNSYPLGGYIIWRAPERKVYVDGRGGPLYSKEFLDDYYEMLKSEKVWKASEEKWGFDYAVLDYDMMSRRFPKYITEDPDWALVYWDNHSAVYLKRTPANQRTIAAYEYRIARPKFYDFSYLNKFEGDEIMFALEGLRREIALNPDNQEPLLARVFLLYKLGAPYYAEIMQDLKTAIRLKPDLAMEHAALSQIFIEYGQTEKAREEAQKALALDPSDPGAVFVGEKLGFKVKKQPEFHH